MSATNLAVTGCAASCGAVLVVAGAGKLYRGVTGLEDMTAIRMALRMPRRPWRLFGLAAGGVECAAKDQQPSSREAQNFNSQGGRQ